MKNEIKTKGIFEQIESIPIVNKLVIEIFNILFFFIRKTSHFFNKGEKNLVIVSFHRLGDTVFTIPAVTEIFNYYKDYKKLILCYQETKKIYEISFDVEMITLTKEDFNFGSRIASSKSRKILKNLKPDIIFDLTGTITSVSLIFNSNAKQIFGMNSQFFKNIYTSFTKIRRAPHLLDVYLDIVDMVIPVNRNEKILEFKSSFNPEDKIIIHPFAIRKAKEWNLKKYITLAIKLNRLYKVEIISPENFLPDDIIEEIVKHKIPFKITKTIDELISEIKTCSLFISNDTGPLYIANLLGKATFTIYGPTNPNYSFPFGKNHRFFRKIIKCSPIKDQFCFTLAGIYCFHYDCFNLITVDEIHSEISEFLEELKITKHNNKSALLN